MLSIGSINPALLASLVAALVSAASIIITAANRRVALRRSGDFAAFASGLLIATAILHLFPESLEATEHAPWLVLAGYAILFSTNQAFAGGARRADRDPSAAAMATPLLAIAFHSLVDGLEYPVLFAHDAYTGALATTGLIIHEVAEGVIVFALARRGGIGVAPAVLLSFLTASLTTPVGAILSLAFISGASPDVIGVLMSLAAGALLYVGASHLPRHIPDPSAGRIPWIFFLGALIASALSFTHAMTGHAH
ncbi:MAG: ZIP family metal transporter [Pseudomonadota bacterium]